LQTRLQLQLPKPPLQLLRPQQLLLASRPESSLQRMRRPPDQPLRQVLLVTQLERWWRLLQRQPQRLLFQLLPMQQREPRLKLQLLKLLYPMLMLRWRQQQTRQN
jgi:hypothetical protein